MTDPQDRAEALDEDMVGEGYPPDEPMGVEEHGVTAAEESTPESYDERSAREDKAGRAVDRPVIRPLAGEGEDLLDEEAQLVAETDPNPRDPDADSAPVPAEEAALHLEGGGS